MPTPTDPYSSATRRPFDEDDILAPIQPQETSAPDSTSGYSSITAGSAEEPTHGMDPAFDSDPARDEHAAASLGDALGTQSETEPTPQDPDPAGSPDQAKTAAPDIFADVDAPTRPADETVAPTDGATGSSSAGSPESHKSAKSEVPPAPHGRGWTHTGVLIATVLLVPFVWYLLADAGIRLGAVANNPWDTGVLNWAAIGELAGGVAVAGLVWMMARRSSLGVQVMGLLTFIVGAVAVVAPVFARDSVVARLDNAIGGYNDFTANVVDHLGNDLASGRLLIFGAFLLLTGLVAHTARRRGERNGKVLAQRAAALNSQVH